MKTYSTYQECKIANPECEVVTTAQCWDGDAIYVGKFQPRVNNERESHWIGYTGWKICNPADYCMTVEQFLNDGYKFVEGDLFINASLFGNGVVVEVGLKNVTEEVANEKQSVDVDCYVLRAAALENQNKSATRLERRFLLTQLQS